jgi:hypothetical protein
MQDSVKVSGTGVPQWVVISCCNRGSGNTFIRYCSLLPRFCAILHNYAQFSFEGFPDYYPGYGVGRY